MDKDLLSTVAPLDSRQRYFLSKKGFIETFEQLSQVSRTKREAYELCEEHHERIIGRRKYSEYTNFRRIRLEFYAQHKKVAKSV